MCDNNIVVKLTCLTKTPLMKCPEATLIYRVKKMVPVTEITEVESKDPTYASVGVATGKYTYNITTNTSYDTVMLHNMNRNLCYGNMHDV